ncbi:hypothetical protein ACFFX1_00430 [Dactylosporangium sucinum]|uniref:hypothetical protein n=1 Tax=Dactylosporangium sucinum TaxID=1424081 RepID=UPI001E3ECF6D|nr:hypothetical protein [Dactylosporangium sucinum]
MSERRYRDPGLRLSDLAGHDIDVVCPRCSAHALVTPTPRRLTCRHCAYTATWRPSPRGTVWGRPVDPYFARPLWLRTRWRSHVVWALNRHHLDILRDYATATLRERGPGGNTTMISRLPGWFKAAKRRKDMLVALSRLYDRL